VRFNSLIYLAFLAPVVVALQLLPIRLRKAWLLVVSALFYASWHPPYLVLLAAIAVLNHFGARWIVAAPHRGRRGAAVIAANVLVLGAFKYLGWLETNVQGLLRLIGIQAALPMPGWVLPLGISFFIFECLSYVVDLVRKRERLHGFWDFLLFVAFFPKLIAGPILRAKELLPQIENPKRVDTDAVVSALWLLLSGLFLKCVVADGLAPGVDAAFARDAKALGTFDVWVMAAGFGLQIYFDFSSYSRMAIGSARLCGIELVENFNHPYVAASPADFWARWHMSLSRWIRDYVFFSVVGRRNTLGPMVYAAIISMVLCGIWHGAGWTFVLWGLWHGLLVAGYHVVTMRRRQSSAPPVGVTVGLIGFAVTFALVMLGWVLFRAPDSIQAGRLLGRAIWPIGHLHRALPGTFYLQVAVVTAAVWAAPPVGSRVVAWWKRAPAAVVVAGQAAGWALLIGVSLIYMRGQTAFIYFQF
jgi:alginate O-acetyltransferase complex protein AlgI